MRNMVVLCGALTAEHRAAITQTASGLGVETHCGDTLAEVKPYLREAEILVSQEVAPLLQAKSVRWVASASAGVEHLLRTKKFDSGEVALTCASGCYGVTISEHIVMTAIMLLRRQMDYIRIVDQCTWKRDLPIRSLRGSRITILGTGDIGTQAAIRFRAFGPAVIRGISRRGLPNEAFDTVGDLSALDAVLPETDLLVMALPGTPATAGLMDERRLALLPSTAYLINVGRGSAIVENALLEMLRDGRLAGAALDVFQKEPILEDSPIWHWPNLLITPHTSGNMTLGWTVDQFAVQVQENLRRYMNGETLLHRVDPAQGY